MIEPGDHGDEELRRMFAELRDADRATSPSYRAVPERIRQQRRFAASRPGSLVLQAAAVTVLVAGGIITYQRLHDTRPHPPAIVAPIVSWKSPTAILLQTPGSELLREIPDLHSSILDQMTPTTKSEAPES